MFILGGGECIGVPRYLERAVGYVLHGQVRGCRVVPTGQDKAGGGILLPKDDPGMGMCN